MAQTVIETKLTGDSTGLVNSVKNAEAEIKKFDRQLQTITTHLNNLASIDLNKLANNIQKVTAIQNITNISAQKGQGVVRGHVNGNSYANVYDVNDPKMATRARNLQDAINKELKEQLAQEKLKTEKIKKDLYYYNEKLSIQQRNSNSQAVSSKAYAEQVELSKLKQPTVTAYQKMLTAKGNAMLPFYNMKGEHPEWFVSNRFDPKYQTGSALMRVGRTVYSSGVVGRIAGTALNVVGSFLKSSAMGIGTSLTEAAKAIKGFTKATVESYAEIEALKTNMNIVFSSRTGADEAFRKLSEYAVKSPFGISQTTELAVLLKQSGVKESELMDTIKMLGDTSGGDMEKMKRIANNYAQIVSIGKASMLDMRQFAYAGIPIFEEISKELGVSQQRLRKLISDGKITSEIVEKVFKNLTGINGVFENATEQGAKTLKARIQNLKDSKQLAMASLGERIVGLGSTYGGDSYGHIALSMAESFYQGMQKWADGKNIEKNIKEIKNRDSRINEYQQAIAYFESKGDKKAVNKLTADMNNYLQLRNPEAERSAYTASYNAKTSEYERLIDLYGEEYLESLESKIDNTVDRMNFDLFTDVQNGISVYNDLYETQKKLKDAQKKGDTTSIYLYQKHLDNLNSIFEDTDKELTEELKEKYIEYEDDFLSMGRSMGGDYQYASLKYKALNDQHQYDDYKLVKQYKKAKADYGLVTDIESLKNAESLNLIQQTISKESVEKASESSSSLSSNMSQIAELVESSDEYRKAQQEALIQTLKDTQETMKEVKKTLNPDGTVDYNKVSVKKLKEWIKAGAISSAERISINLDDPKKGANDRVLLSKNFAIMNGRISDYMASPEVKEQTRDVILKSLNNIQNVSSVGNDKQFFETFNRSYSTIVKEVEKQISTGLDTDFWQEVLLSIQSIIVKLGADISDDLLFADIEDLLKTKTGDEIIPLWKRLLGGITGLTSNAITSTSDALDMFRNNMSPRNYANSVLGAALNNGYGVDLVTSKLRTNGVYQQVGENGLYAYQIDWKKTKESLEDFSYNLSASSDIISAYSQSLKNEYETYVQLLTSVVTSGESQDIKSQKIISAKKAGQIIQNANEQLVNAFAGNLTDRNGQKVTWNKQGGYFENENGVPIIEEQLQITDSLFEYIKKTLPEIKKEIVKTGNGDAINRLYNNLVGRAASKALDPVLSSFSSIYDRLDDSLKDILREQVISSIRNTNIGGVIGENGKYRSVEDMIASALNENDSRQENAMGHIERAAKNLMNTFGGIDQFGYLLDLLEDNKDVEEKPDDTVIPLWKRILAQYTGLEATTITGTESALTAYRDNLAIRNIVGQTFNAMLQNGASPEIVRNLIRTSGVVSKNAYDKDNVYQIDWKETQRSLKEFAMQLSASTDVIGAYNKGLEEQYSTYIGLLGTGILQGETAGNKSRVVSVKQLEKSLQSYGDQLINAFGEGVRTKDGRTVKWTKETGFTDENGKAINEDELVLTGKVFDFLEEEIPKIREELVKGNKVAAENKVLGNITGTLADTKLMSAFLSRTESAGFARLSDENKQVYMETLKNNLKLKNTGFDSVDDLLLAYINGDGKATSIVDKAIDELTNATSALDGFGTLLDRLNENELRNNANRLASDLIAGDGPERKKSFRYSMFEEPILRQLGYGDVNLNDVAELMGPSKARRNSEKISSINRLAAQLQHGEIGSMELVGSLQSLGVEEDRIDRIGKENLNIEKQIKLLRELADAYGRVTEKEVAQNLAQKSLELTFENMVDSCREIIKTTSQKGFLAPFETLGESLFSMDSYFDNLTGNLRSLGAEMTKQLGTVMETAGFNIASACAMTQNWGGVIAGLALAGAGGVASGLGTAISKNKDEDKTGRLQSITDQLKELLEQARKDALYYENNMRHQEALGKNKEYSYRSVNDAIIDTHGQIISTSPKDYLLAMQDPRELVRGGGVTVQPQIKFTVENNAGVNVRQEQRQNSDGTIEVIAVIESVMDNYIASGRSDQAFTARAARLGRNTAVR